MKSPTSFKISFSMTQSDPERSQEFADRVRDLRTLAQRLGGGFSMQGGHPDYHYRFSVCHRHLDSAADCECVHDCVARLTALSETVDTLSYSEMRQGVRYYLIGAGQGDARYPIEGVRDVHIAISMKIRFTRSGELPAQLKKPLQDLIDIMGNDAVSDPDNAMSPDRDWQIMACEHGGADRASPPCATIAINGAHSLSIEHAKAIKDAIAFLRSDPKCRFQTPPQIQVFDSSHPAPRQNFMRGQGARRPALAKSYSSALEH